MSKKIVNTEKAPSPVGPYNQSIVVGGPMVFVSGQIALDPATNTLVMDSIEEETHQVMKNVEAVLAANDCTMDNVVSCSVFVKDMEHYGQINAVYGSYFKEDTAPTRALVEVSRLPKDVRVEVSAIAVKEV
ncbi:Rid family detoxifying hydrolase [Membranicola marinus]|uniref:Rid family detoxifying hydrolase n=1 Tax=Membranihabitans marinus TaxID=1227546 RepID=A0A953HKS5_9BACT|nr:Rid family detoxifying hydrolase [Membranihabitans marinus]MBY5957714.1 Rid family detoxifying hydrolase [Membranihabitans marinus]